MVDFFLVAGTVLAIGGGVTVLLALVAMVLTLFDIVEADEWIAAGLLGGFVAILVGFVTVAPALMRESKKEAAAFMRACMQDKKEYECTAMWRAGNGSSTVVPMPIIIPVR